MKAADVPPKWQWHYRALLALRRALLEEHEARHTALRSPTESGGRDALDQAAERQEQDELLAELSAEDAEIGEIDAALERIRAGTYGTCIATGEPISPARLRALPWTRFSREAAEKRERHRDGE